MSENDIFLGIIKNIKKHKIDFIVVGGLARFLYAPNTAMTIDIDIVVPKNEETCKKLISFAKKYKYKFMLGDEKISIKNVIDFYPLRYIKLCSKKHPEIDVFLGRSYDDVPFNEIDFRWLRIDEINFKIATLRWLVDHAGNRPKDLLNIQIIYESFNNN